MSARMPVQPESRYWSGQVLSCANIASKVLFVCLNPVSNSLLWWMAGSSGAWNQRNTQSCWEEFTDLESVPMNVYFIPHRGIMNRVKHGLLKNLRLRECSLNMLSRTCCGFTFMLGNSTSVYTVLNGAVGEGFAWVLPPLTVCAAENEW